jgi:hypothetical protein
MNFQEGCQGLDKKRPSKILGVLNRTQTAKGISTRTLCQRSQGTAKTTQKPVTVGDRATYRALSSDRTPPQNVIDR